ncbi:MAG: AMP-binding protein [bacterium]
MRTSTRKNNKNKIKLTTPKQFSVFFDEKAESIIELWESYSVEYADVKVVIDKYSGYEFTYKEFYEKIKFFSYGLQSLGLKKGEHVSLFSENTAKWILSDQAILFAGAVDAVRGAASPDEELKYILEHSDSVGLIAENISVISRLKDNLINLELKFVVCLSDEDISSFITEKIPVYRLDEVIEIGKTSLHNPIKIKKDDLATLIYTSGTTGSPKAVMLTHGNFLYQIKALLSRIKFVKGHVSLSVLPTWHAYQRTGEYCILASGGTLAYTNLLNLKDDIKIFKPDCFFSVPRLWEAFYTGITAGIEKQSLSKKNFIKSCLKISKMYIKFKRLAENADIYNHNASLVSRLNALFISALLRPIHNFADKSLYHKIRSVFGGNLYQGITGGGAIARHLDDFYEIIGINLLNAYGLTETSPGIAANSLEENLRGSVGRPLDETELKIVDPETLIPVKNNETGVVLVRGPQVMSGYYKNPEETDKILSKDGWINTGDLGWITRNGELVLSGRAKDIIVLSNGENIEPQPIEEACLKSPFIDQIMLVGQDKDSLGALVIPNEESIKLWFENRNIKDHESSEITKKPEVKKLFKQVLTECVKSRPHYRPFEKIQYFKILNEPFTIENGLMTQTMKLRKNEIQKRYESLIQEMFE